MKQSKKHDLNLRDIARGFLMAAGSAALTILSQVLQNEDGNIIPTLAELKTAAAYGLTAGVMYIIKNYFTASDAEIAAKKMRP